MTQLRNDGVAVAEIRQTVSDITRTVLERDVDPAIDVFDQGATSLAFLRIVAKLNEWYGIEMDVAELEEASIESVSALIAQQLDGQATATATATATARD